MKSPYSRQPATIGVRRPDCGAKDCRRQIYPKNKPGTAALFMKPRMFLGTEPENSGLILRLHCSGGLNSMRFEKNNSELTKYPIFMGWLGPAYRSVIVSIKKLSCCERVSLSARDARLQKGDPAHGYLAAVPQCQPRLAAEKIQKGSPW